MAKAHFTPEADQALAQIATDSQSAALLWVSEIKSVCEVLAEQPNLGLLLQTKRLGRIRRHTAGNYLIYYRPDIDGVEIMHVVHRARDQDRNV